MDDREKFSSYQHGETRTGLGHGVKFSCRPEDKEAVAAFFRDKVRSVDVFVTRTTVSHGSYGGRSRYEIKQHEYIAGQSEDSGDYRFIEVLEIMDTPDGRHPFVIHDKSSYQSSSFSEWRSVEEAMAAHEIAWKCQERPRLFERDAEPDTWAPIRGLSGFKRVVRCGALTPWFYAIGEELLIGDYTFPDGFQDDSVYRFGAKFVVCGADGVLSLKTCMGTRFIHSDYDGYADKKKPRTRLVHWDDGTCWDEHKSRFQPPLPAQEGEMWIVEAMEQFRILLAGKQTSFEIPFANGLVLRSKLERGQLTELESPPGEYEVSVVRTGDGKPSKTKAHFRPSKKLQTVREWVVSQLELQCVDFESFEVTLIKADEDGKHWTGAFLAPPKNK